MQSSGAAKKRVVSLEGGASANSMTQALLDSTDMFIFDCDGVIWKGEIAISGARECILKLRSLGKRIYFVTNNSSKSRKTFISKFSKLGIEIFPEGKI